MNERLAPRERAEAGRQKLNERGPANWPSLVNPETVDVYSIVTCVLAQIYCGDRDPVAGGHFSRGLGALGLDDGELYGFCDMAGPAETAQLNAEWRRIIAEERAVRGGEDA